MYKSLKSITENDPSAREELNYLIRQAERYEKLRRLNALQFCDLFRENIATGIHFDALVDDIKEF